MGQETRKANSTDEVLEVACGKTPPTRLVNDDANLRHIGQDGQYVLTSTNLDGRAFLLLLRVSIFFCIIDL